MQRFDEAATVVRRDVYRDGQVWSEHALRVLSDTGEVLVTACAPGAQARLPSPYAAAGTDRSARLAAFDALAAGSWELSDARRQETELLLWKPAGAWYSVNAFYTADGLRNWYINFERPARRRPDGFDTFDLAVDLVVEPDLTAFSWKDEDEYAHARRLGVITDAEHLAVKAARDEVVAMIEARSGILAEAAGWAAWRWAPDWATPLLPRAGP
ncbi:DUF402 domain-containing protein [Streptomyces sp. SID8379]|uniref:DUF402 domain-containing protein n=1 Tax=unclassified Streptomyces TaxID=2593676 RepID=UPI000361B3EB|nr:MULTISPECIES: DUF402 domain-containing protein [unclassified Streptomyces]MYW70139.1 DUF402 domain-containing protein [Streptomyces sp. SID8379]